MMNTSGKQNSCRVVLFERWPHACATELLLAYPHLDVKTLTFSMPEAETWKALSGANVYQARSTRSELPPEYWVNAPLLKACPKLLAVSTNGSGSDTVDLDACTQAGVLAVNQAGGNKQAVAEHTFGMMLCLSKRIIEADRAMRTQGDLQREKYMGHEIRGATLGLIGLGHIGTHIAQLAKGLFGMRVVAYDPYLEVDDFARRGAESVSLEVLLADSDFVSVHCPRNASSEHMLNAAAFASMKPTAYFITTARGGIHDERALAKALQSGRIAGAGLDVWDQEPPNVDHPLFQFDNVIASPHTAGVTHESRANVVRITIEQIDAIARGERPPRLLNPEVWPRYVERFRSLYGRNPG